MSAESLPYLIAAASGRALAASAARAGHATVVVDYFADADTRAITAVRRAAAPGRLEFDEALLLRESAALAPIGACAGVVYGSGFEDRTALLAQLCTGRRLYGNAPRTVAMLKDPCHFFPLLDELGIAHPEVRLERPCDPQGWLAKRIGGCGGDHVLLARHCPAGARDFYYQRFESGRSLSVLFLANGRRAHIVGFNEQWHAGRMQAAPFAYGGAVGGVRVPPEVRAELANALDRLVAATGLVGINGLDFLLQDSCVSVLELNPRPTSTTELYDADYPDGLFAWHLAACDGALPASPPQPLLARAHAIVFADRGLCISDDVQLPEWCVDRPVPGTYIAAGAPLCTVHACGRSAEQAAQLLRQRHQGLTGMLCAEGA
jgi:predicted ATP-grasp superfamily ATP-dependent carboligase